MTIKWVDGQWLRWKTRIDMVRELGYARNTKYGVTTTSIVRLRRRRHAITSENRLSRAIDCRLVWTAVTEFLDFAAFAIKTRL